jgi:hypothetical protein
VTEKPLAFLSLIKALENAVGHTTKYALLDPFPCITVRNGKPAYVEIQGAGKTIARHVGLSDLTFIISITTQDPSIAGHIELRYGEPDVFVEISTGICDHKDAVLATLCHEVSHKFLHVHGIRHGNLQIEQEFLTDVAAVYLGMGKIMLNGCECQKSYTKTEGNKTVTTTHTLKTGYISRECFAFVYRLVCAMRKIPATQFLAGLSEPAKQAISECEQRFGEWFRSDYHSSEQIEKLCADLRDALEGGQAKLAAYDYTLRRANEFINVLQTSIRDSHKPLLEADRQILELQAPNHNPHLRFLGYIETRETVNELIAKSKNQAENKKHDWRRLETLVESLSSPDSDIVECPIDGTRLRVPSGRKRLQVTCNICKYKFIVTTAKHPEAHQTVNRRKSSLLKSLKAAFGRK